MWEGEGEENGVTRQVYIELKERNKIKKIEINNFDHDVENCGTSKVDVVEYEEVNKKSKCSIL